MLTNEKLDLEEKFDKRFFLKTYFSFVSIFLVGQVKDRCEKNISDFSDSKTSFSLISFLGLVDDKIETLKNFSQSSITHLPPVQTDGEECEDAERNCQQSNKVVDPAQNTSKYPNSENKFC